MMHWLIKACRVATSTVPYWRMQLHDGVRSYGEIFTCYQLRGVFCLVKYHDRLYPVRVVCTWSPAVESNARAALERSGLSLTDNPIPL